MLPASVKPPTTACSGKPVELGVCEGDALCEADVDSDAVKLGVPEPEGEKDGVPDSDGVWLGVPV